MNSVLLALRRAGAPRSSSSRTYDLMRGTRLTQLRGPYSRVLRNRAVNAHRANYSGLSVPDGVNSGGVAIRIANGSSQTINVSEIWLRDNCQCLSCTHPQTKQRDLDTFKIASDIKPLGMVNKADGVHINWSDGHKSTYGWAWLNETQNPVTPLYREMWEKTPWTTDVLAASGPSAVDFAQVMDSAPRTANKAMKQLMGNIHKWGFSFVTATPIAAEPTQQLLEKIGPIRTTHYGGFYDFTPNMEKADTAYTNIALPAHTDTTYFTEPAGLQAFHMLSHQPPPGAGESSSKEGLGGESLLVDGFQAAISLRQQNPDAFRTLWSVPIPWHASGNDGVAIAPDRRYPVIETADGEVDGPVTRIRWNNADRGVVPHATREQANEWYKAARLFDELLRHRKSEYWFQLHPGTVLIFDNWRVLHGRSAFEGVRRMCGAYIPRDDYISRWKTSRFDLETYMHSNLFQPGYSSK